MCTRRRWRRIPARVPSLSSIYLRSKLTRHEGGNGAASRLALKEYTIHGINNWHLHSLAHCKLASALGGDDTLSHRFPILENVFQLPTLSYLDADCAISTERAGAGQHQITEPCQTSKSALLRSQRRAQSCHLRQTTCHQRSSGVEAEPKTFRDARRNSHDVLESATELDPSNIRMSVGAEIRGAESALRDSGGSVMFRGYDNRGRLTADDLAGKAWPRQRNHRCAWKLLFGDVSHEAKRFSLDSFRCDD